MAVLLDDLLDVARITSGRLELRRARVAVRQLVDDALETVRPLAEAKRHLLLLQLQEPLPALDADPVRVVQILSNLLTNAAKYTDAGGRLGLNVRPAGEAVMFEVWDEGIGIAPEALPTLFEMFSQAGASRDRSEGGLGIGLALTRGLVTLHGGRIEAASEGPGRGSRFMVTLPVARVEPSGAEPAVPPLADAPGPLTLLVVDDNVDAAEALALLLQAQGYTVHLAHSGTEALAVGAAVRPTVGLLDLGMPGMSGYELAEALRATDWGGRMALAVISGWGREGDRRRAATAGFDHHFTKPVDPAELAAWLRERAQPPR
jgi:CheY-like chemotaxis protein/two-component sensor histidine kinase